MGMVSFLSSHAKPTRYTDHTYKRTKIVFYQYFDPLLLTPCCDSFTHFVDIDFGRFQYTLIVSWNKVNHGISNKSCVYGLISRVCIKPIRFPDFQQTIPPNQLFWFLLNLLRIFLRGKYCKYCNGKLCCL